MLKNRKIRLKLMRINPLSEKIRIKKAKSIRRIEKKKNFIKKEAFEGLLN
jgi:hypothetical protein